MPIVPLEVGCLHTCCKAGAGDTLPKYEPHKWNEAIEQDKLDGIYITSSHCHALGLVSSVQELPLVRLALLLCQLGIGSRA